MYYDVIIIGGGPAGLTAAIYTSRARLKTLVIESYSVPGQAIITDSIENFPGFPEGINGFELVEKFKKQAEKFGAELIVKNVEKIEQLKDGWRIKAEDKTYTTLSIIIATGVHPRKLDVPGEHKFTGKGVSYCATCDGALYRDKHVVVIGGGDTAIDEALFLTRFAKKVTLIHRRDRLRGTKILQERVLANKKMEFVWESNVIEILGKERIEGVKINNIKTKKDTDLSCDGVFVFVGYEPNTVLAKGLLKLDKKSYILADEDMNTSKKGIFSCGDCRKKLLRQVVTACGDGATAAFNAQQYVEKLKGTAYE